MDTQYRKEFLSLLDSEKRDEAISYAITLVRSEKLTLEELYLELLTPALTEFRCTENDESICIWKEHARTSTIRTILEGVYPEVINRRKATPSRNKKVVVLCPSEEYHEVGAIIASHFFSLAGFDAQYIGANTPRMEILSAVKATKPDIIALSVTNYYNLVEAKKVTSDLKSKFPDLLIVVGGQAFSHEDALNQIVYDVYISNPTDISKLYEVQQ